MNICSKIIYGKGKGKKIGFPTANLEIDNDKNKNQLKRGVFAGRMWIGEKKYQTAIFIGPKKEILEVYLLDFSGNLYGEKLEVEIGEKLRDVIKFKNDKELIEQIEKDIEMIRSNTK